MKKGLSIVALWLAILLIALSCAGCGGANKTNANATEGNVVSGEDIIKPGALFGTFHLTEYYNVDSPDDEDYRDAMTLVIRDDCTGDLTDNRTGESTPVTVDMAKMTITWNDVTAGFTLNGKTLEIIAPGEIFTFAREAQATPSE